MFFSKNKLKKIFQKNFKIYQDNEKKQKRNISLRKLEAFQPTTFNKIGYQTDIQEFEELWKFSDIMQEGRFSQNIEKGLYNFIEKKEFLILKDLIKFFSEYSYCLGKKNLPLNSLSRSLISYRFINQNFPKKSKILELGPGSGLLGMLLLKDGFNYDTYEVTKSFYLYQKITLQSFLNFFKLKNRTKNLEWWTILENPQILKNYDIIIGNHMLNEMHPNALNYVFSKINKKSQIFFEGSGYNLEGDQERFIKISEKKSYKLVYYKNLIKDDIYFGVIKNSKSNIKSFPNFQKNIFIFIWRIVKYISNNNLSSYFSILRGRDIGDEYCYNLPNKKNYLYEFRRIISDKAKDKYVNDDDYFMFS